MTYLKAGLDADRPNAEGVSRVLLQLGTAAAHGERAEIIEEILQRYGVTTAIHRCRFVLDAYWDVLNGGSIDIKNVMRKADKALRWA